MKPSAPGPTITPHVTHHLVNGHSIERFGKFEITFELDYPYPPDSFLPYYFFDPADPQGTFGITIDAEFQTPSGARLIAPAFYFVEHRRGLDWHGRTRVTPTGRRVWQVRFTPREEGEYAYSILIRDRHGMTRYPQTGVFTFTCAPSDRKGFVRVSPRDPRFLEWEDGTSFVPISAGQQWWQNKQTRSAAYERTFIAFRKYGINLTRVWDQCDGWALTVEGPFDGYDGYASPNGNPEEYGEPDWRRRRLSALKRGTQMNPRGNFEEDLIVRAAEQNRVYLLLCSVGDPKWIWDATVHDTRDREIDWNGPGVAFDDPRHLACWQRNFRYRVARWGYSTAVLAWETWNEHGPVAPGSDAYRFYQQYGAYQRATDLYAHLRTTSQQSQTWSAGLWASPAFEIATYHDYMMPSRYDDEMAHDAALFVYKLAQYLRMREPPHGIFVNDDAGWHGTEKPILWSEWDTGTPRWNEANPQPRSRHASLWAGLFSPLGMSPVDWYWYALPEAQTKYPDAKIAADFFRDTDYAGAQFEYLATDDVRVTVERIETTHADLRVLAMRRGDGMAAYAWLQHRATRRYDGASEGAPLNGAFFVNSLKPGVYRVHVWDTYTGEIKYREIGTDGEGRLTVPVANLTRDLAVSIEATLPDRKTGAN